MFPDTPEKENRKISEMRANRNTTEPMFQKGSDSAMLGMGQPKMVFKDGENSSGEGTVYEQMLGSIFSLAAK